MLPSFLAESGCGDSPQDGTKSFSNRLPGERGWQAFSSPNFVEGLGRARESRETVEPRFGGFCGDDGIATALDGLGITASNFAVGLGPAARIDLAEVREDIGSFVFHFWRSVAG